MTTLYKNHMTIATPQHLIEAANHLALIMGESAADINTFTAANYQDSAGNLYAVCSTVVTDGFLAKQGTGIKRIPSHAKAANVEMAKKAQALLQINGGIATPDVIAVILGDRLESAQDHIKALGLERVQQDDKIG